MKRTLSALVAGLVVLSVAVGGAVAAGELGETELNGDDGADDGPDVGVCVVGADSPCNGGDEADADHGNESSNGTGHVWIPEDQNRDGEIDDRFHGNESEGGDAGICLVGAESPCNGGNATESTGDRIAAPGDGERRAWIPEDQNRDGEIDDRFLSDGGSAVAELVFRTLAAF